MVRHMSVRLIVALVTTPLELALVFYVGRYLLPNFSINIPLLALIAIMAACLGWSVFGYRKGSHALRRKLLDNQTSMIGSSCVVTKDLLPNGMVRISGELWQARSAESHITSGTQVVVVGQDGLRLIVRLAGTAK
jgi:membrane protein implicated in regulation of membrane protease activity